MVWRGGKGRVGLGAKAGEGRGALNDDDGVKGSDIHEDRKHILRNEGRRHWSSEQSEHEIHSDSSFLHKLQFPPLFKSQS